MMPIGSPLSSCSLFTQVHTLSHVISASVLATSNHNILTGRPLRVSAQIQAVRSGGKQKWRLSRVILKWGAMGRLSSPSRSTEERKNRNISVLSSSTSMKNWSRLPRDCRQSMCWQLMEMRWKGIQEMEDTARQERRRMVKMDNACIPDYKYYPDNEHLVIVIEQIQLALKLTHRQQIHLILTASYNPPINHQIKCNNSDGLKEMGLYDECDVTS